MLVTAVPNPESSNKSTSCLPNGALISFLTSEIVKLPPAFLFKVKMVVSPLLTVIVTFFMFAAVSFSILSSSSHAVLYTVTKPLIEATPSIAVFCFAISSSYAVYLYYKSRRDKRLPTLLYILPLTLQEPQFHKPHMSRQ